MSNPNDPLNRQIHRLMAENQQLREQLNEREAEVYRLLQWLSQLQRDIRDVYASFSWRVGDSITRQILKLLRRPVGPTARDHVARVNRSIEAWKKNHLLPYRQQGRLMSYTPWHDSAEYHQWLSEFDRPTAEELDEMHLAQENWEQQFILLLVLPDEYERAALQKTVASVVRQIYPLWTLYVIAPQARLEGLDFLNGERIHCVSCAPESPLSERLNVLLQREQDAHYVMCLQLGDMLHQCALHYVAQAAQEHSRAWLIYSDEDRLDKQWHRYDPHFKPDWNPDLLLAQDYLQRGMLHSLQAIKEAGGFSAAYPRWESYELTLRLLQQRNTDNIVHIPRVLYHAQPQTRDASVQQAAVQAYVQQQNPHIRVAITATQHLRVRYPLPDNLPLVSVIIPTRDKLELLMATVDGLLYQTDYANLEIIVLDNGSQDSETRAYLHTMDQQQPSFQVIRHDAPFNYSQLNNLGAKQAQGELLALLNNDLKMQHKDWLQEMVSHALRHDIGAVGAKLYYAGDTLQHAGVVTGLGGLAGHGFKHVLREAPAYQWRPFVTQNIGAVTAACLVLRKSVFAEIGGFDEKLKVAFNDVDLCLRLRQAGYRILWTPHAELYHLESASRGADDTAKKYRQLQKEIAFMRKRWGDFLQIDPYYSPNLTIQYEDYSLAWPPRVK